MLREKAIIIAANLKGDFYGGPTIGSILAHASHIERQGAVLWQIVPPGFNSRNSFPHPNIKRGYFYNVTDKAVTHIFDIDYIKPTSIMNRQTERKYLLESRKKAWESKYNFYYVKITAIFRLKREHKYQDFIKFSDNRPLQYLRNYAIVVDAHFAYHNQAITRREIMSDYIADLLERKELKEKDIEELFSYRLANKLSLLDRQGAFRKAGRLDLLYQNNLGNCFIYELKKGIARLDALKQIKRYMNACEKKYKKCKNIKGIILAKSIDPELSQALRSEKNIGARTYFFSIELK